MDNQDLRDEAGRTILYRPIIIVEATEDGKQQYRLHPTELDPLCSDPRLFGIVLSDLLDHIARAYADVSSRDVRDIRATIAMTMRNEDRFKARDPARGNLRGVTILPKSN